MCSIVPDHRIINGKWEEENGHAVTKRSGCSESSIKLLFNCLNPFYWGKSCMNLVDATCIFDQI